MTYTMSQSQGYLLIINNQNFQWSERNRPWSAIDVQLLLEVFQNIYNFHVYTVKDPTVQHIRDTMANLPIDEIRRSRCFVVIILSHGGAYDMVYAYDTVYNITQEILNSHEFKRLKKLSKVLITQMCKHELTENTVDPKCTAKNVFRFDSTWEGTPSFAEREGTPFIRTLCKYLKSDINLNFTEVADKVINDEIWKTIRQYPTTKVYDGYVDFSLFTREQDGVQALHVIH